MLRSKVEQNELLEEQLRNADAEKVGEAKEIPPLLILQRGSNFRCNLLEDISQTHFRVWSSFLQADKSSPSINRGKRTLLRSPILQRPKMPITANQVISKCIVLFYPSSCTLAGPVSIEGLSSFCCQEPLRSCLAQWVGVEEINCRSTLKICFSDIFLEAQTRVVQLFFRS